MGYNFNDDYFDKTHRDFNNKDWSSDDFFKDFDKNWETKHDDFIKSSPSSMDIFIPIVICFVIFLLCTICGICCRKRRNEGAIFSTPVIVTSSTHTQGPYPVTVAAPPPSGNITSQTTYAPMQGQPGFQPQQQSHFGVYPMPQPQSTGFGAPYPPTQYPSAMPPYPTAGTQGMPMPSASGPVQNVPANINPPSYDQVVGTDVYQKQAPYNPNFSS